MPTLQPPPYGTRTLPDLLPAVLSSLGVPGETDVLGLAPARRVCVLLVDGLGAELLAAADAHAPVLTALRGTTLQAGFPSTTATSVASLGTGLPPGSHGLTGLTVARPDSDEPLNLLRWRDEVDPLAWQPAPTAYERAAADGVAVTAVAPGSFAGSGLTRAALRGARLAPARTAGEVVVGAARALSEGDRSLVYAYYGDLDSTGHHAGCGSEQWAVQLEHVDRLVAQLLERLPVGAVLHVTADHGMVDIDRGLVVELDDQPALLEGVRVLAGEVRARHVHTRPGARDDVAAAWRERLDGTAVVLTREQAVDAGWFGRVRPAVLPRIGDLVVAATGRGGVLRSTAEPHQSALIGQHGSLTPAEQLVPLLTATA